MKKIHGSRHIFRAVNSWNDSGSLQSEQQFFFSTPSTSVVPSFSSIFHLNLYLRRRKIIRYWGFPPDALNLLKQREISLHCKWNEQMINR